MVTDCNELNFKVGTELAHKCKSYRLRPCSHCTDRLSESPENRIGWTFCSYLTTPVRRNSCDSSDALIPKVIRSVSDSFLERSAPNVNDLYMFSGLTPFLERNLIIALLDSKVGLLFPDQNKY